MICRVRPLYKGSINYSISDYVYYTCDLLCIFCLKEDVVTCLVLGKVALRKPKGKRKVMDALHITSSHHGD